MSAPPLTSGVVAEELSDDIRPQDDLYRYVNERWIERTAIPGDKPGYGTFWILAEASERAIREIVEEATAAPEGSEARKFGDLYASFMNEARVEGLGAEPLARRLAAAAQVESIDDLLGTIGDLQRGELSGFYELFVNPDPGNPGRYVVFFEQGGISLPDESYYRDDQFAPVCDAFVAHVRRMLELAGLSDPEPRAQRVFELEREIARRHWDNVTSRDSEKTYNLLTWSAASELFGDGATASDHPPSLDAWAEAFGAPEHAFDEVVLRQPSFTHDLAALFDEARLDAWRDWLAWRIILGYAPYLSKDFVEEHFDFYGRTLTGTQELRERWKRGVSLVEGAMGEAVGQIYVERHFPPTAKARVDVLVGNLVGAYRESITALDWMSEETRARALEKLAAFMAKVGYPPKWRDYSTLVIDPADLIANVRSVAAFEFRRQLAKIGQPIDRDEWLMTPQTVNAYYNPEYNEIVFPAAILQPPFFDESRDDAANYGAVGAVIGHEIGHGFDDQGSKFDGTGRLIDWWTASDRAAFEERTHSLIDQFNALAPREVPDRHVNGALTIGENIGDLGGLGIAWKAYVLSLNGEPSPVIDGFTGAQRFFVAWARAWQNKARKETVEMRLAIDEHSPPEFRCNQIVRNLDEFYEAFGVGASDELWLDPAQRVTIW